MFRKQNNLTTPTWTYDKKLIRRDSQLLETLNPEPFAKHTTA